MALGIRHLSQLIPIQIIVFVASPGQGGRIHCRLLSFVPVPHCFVHRDHGPHSDQFISWKGRLVVVTAGGLGQD